jgi:GTP 3',8-cyclase
MPFYSQVWQQIYIKLDSDGLISASIPSMQPPSIRLWESRRSRWQQVWEGILAADRAGFEPLKLNVVVIPGVNDTEVLDLAALSIDKQWHIRFIEFMPIGNDELFSDRGWISSESIRQQIRAKSGSYHRTMFQIGG